MFLKDEKQKTQEKNEENNESLATTYSSGSSCSIKSNNSKVNKQNKKQKIQSNETKNEENSSQLFLSSLETLKRLYPSYKSKYLEKILLEFNGDLVNASKQLSLSNKDQNSKTHHEQISPILKSKNDHQVSNYLNEQSNNSNNSETLPSMFYPPSTLMQHNFNQYISNTNNMPKPPQFSPMTYFGQFDQKYPNTYLNDQTALALQQFNAAVASIPFSYRHTNVNNGNESNYNPFQLPYFPPIAAKTQQHGFTNDLFSYTNDLHKTSATCSNTTPSSSSSSSSSSPSSISNGLLCISSSTPSSAKNLNVDTTMSNCSLNKNNKLSSK